jgi:hypothetical protein
MQRRCATIDTRKSASTCRFFATTCAQNAPSFEGSPVLSGWSAIRKLGDVRVQSADSNECGHGLKGGCEQSPRARIIGRTIAPSARMMLPDPVEAVQKNSFSDVVDSRPSGAAGSTPACSARAPSRAPATEIPAGHGRRSDERDWSSGTSQECVSHDGASVR